MGDYMYFSRKEGSLPCTCGVCFSWYMYNYPQVTRCFENEIHIKRLSQWDIFPSTPLKINMEPKHYPTEKENHLLSTSIFEFKMLIFGGVGVSSLPLASDDFSQHVSVNRSGLQDSKCADSRVMVWVGIVKSGLFVCVFWWSKDFSSLGGIQTPGSNIIFAPEHFDDWKTIVLDDRFVLGWHIF